jgi:hypothetical protein
MATFASASTAYTTITTHPLGHLRTARCSLGGEHLSKGTSIARKPALRVERRDHLRRSTSDEVGFNPRGFRSAVSSPMNPIFLSFTTVRKVENAIA